MTNIVHLLKKDVTETMCGETIIALGGVIDWEVAFDPEHPSSFSCGACWKALTGGVEPMGGSLHLSAAHGAGEDV